MHKRIRVLIWVGVFLCVCVALVLVARNRLFLDPVLLCFTPVPSEEVVVRAIRYGPGDGGPGVGDDGVVYSVRPLECPHRGGVGSFKLSMLLRAEAEGIVEERVIGVMIIDSQHIVVHGFRD